METTTQAEAYLTYEQAAEEFGTSHFALRKLANSGALTRHKAAKDGRIVLLSRAELVRLHTNVPKD